MPTARIQIHRFASCRRLLIHFRNAFENDSEWSSVFLTINMYINNVNVFKKLILIL